MILNWIQIGIASFITASAAWALHSLDIYRMEDNQRTELANKTAELTNQCNTEKTILQRANDDLQTRMAANAARNARDKRLHPSTCIMPKNGMAQPSTSGGGYAGQNGTVAGSSDDFRDYAKECNDYRTALMVLDKFKTDWEAAHGQ